MTGAFTLGENASTWLLALAEGRDPRREVKGRAITEALLVLRRFELIDVDGRITAAGKKVVRLGATS